MIITLSLCWQQIIAGGYNSFDPNTSIELIFASTNDSSESSPGLVWLKQNNRHRISNRTSNTVSITNDTDFTFDLAPDHIVELHTDESKSYHLTIQSNTINHSFEHGQPVFNGQNETGLSLLQQSWNCLVCSWFSIDYCCSCWLRDAIIPPPYSPPLTGSALAYHERMAQANAQAFPRSWDGYWKYMDKVISEHGFYE